jgi:transcriptional regulator with XRE-family HTH domain
MRRYGRGMTTPAQSRAARGLLNVTQAELATWAGLGLSTVRDFETERRKVSPEAENRITEALRRAGVEFIPENTKSNPAGAGVRLAKRVHIAR